MTDLVARRAQLSQRLAALMARAGRVEGDLMQPMSADSEEQASEIEDDEALAAEDHMVSQEISAVRAAIGRIDSGHYGVCVSCGGPISEARLDLVPEASLCSKCM